MEESIALQDCRNGTVTDTSGKETLIFNVGGVKFETYRSTLLRMSNGPLADNAVLLENFRQERNDYFFDRDPEVFKVVINYLRTGSVIIPPGIDETHLKNELTFWGLTSAVEQSGNTQVSTGRWEQAGINREGTYRDGNEHKVWQILSKPSTSMWAKLYAGVSYVLMCLSVVILVFETTPILQISLSGEADSDSDFPTNDSGRRDKRYPGTTLAASIIVSICCLFFTVEYILRVIFAPNRLRFIFSFLGAIDILAILPEYAVLLFSLLITVNVSALHRLLSILCVFRIFRLLRVFKHFKDQTGTELIVRALKSSVGELVLLFGVTVIGVLAWGTLMFYLEYGKDDMYVIGFDSIPEVCWFVIVTMTTVGYGDMIPMTVESRIVGALCAVSGLLVITLLVSVLVNKMKICSKEMQKTRNYQLTTPGSTTQERCHP